MDTELPFTVCLLKWKAHWPVTLVHTCWWSGWAWVHRHCGGICFSRLRLPTLLRQRHCPHPMRGHPQLSLPFQKHPGRNISRSGVQLPSLFLSVAYQHFSMEKCDYAKKMFWQEMKEDSMFRQGQISSAKKKQRKETSQTPKTEQTILPNNALGKNHHIMRGNIKSCAARALNTDSWWSCNCKLCTHV